MNCFMSYNPNVAKEVKVTTWIKEFDGASPIYPSFPKDGDVFIVFDSDEDKTPSVNKTFSSGDWADTESDAPTGTIEITENGEGIDVSSYAYADVNVSGGGSSDFTTCTVTVLDSQNNSSVCKGLPVVLEDDEYNLHGIATSDDYYPSSPYTIPLYKGKAYILDPGKIDSYSGNITFDQDALTYIITGDCTIVVSSGGGM